MAENKIELKSVNELLGMKFFIPSYQRGYRWTEQQVKDLLSDIWEFSKKKKQEYEFYCLQPLVVKLMSNEEKTKCKLISNDEWYEVIDGQQRLTTIFLILSSLKDAISILGLPTCLYEMKYQRESKEFNVTNFLNDISESREINDSYIDFFYMSSAFRTIEFWMKNNNVNKGDFCNALLKYELDSNQGKPHDKANNVRFIWYESVNEDPIKVFTRLNIGKISLTNAELIKALFLNRSNFGEKDSEHLKLRQQEIASEWDNIEYTLQNDEFWLFLHEKGYDRPTRIDFIFDLICGQNSLKLEGKLYDSIGTDDYRTFRYFYEYFKSEPSKIKDCWKEVKKYFQTFKEWFDDLELYHYIGYLIEYTYSISGLVSQWLSSLDKDSFVKHLKTEIKTKIIDKCPRLDFQYKEDGNDKGRCKPILLFQNIQTVINQNKNNLSNEDYKLGVFYKFPFHLYKLENWDVEHINSNTTNDEEDADTQNEWLLNVYLSADDDTQQKIRSYFESSNDKKEKLFEEIKKKISQNEEWTPVEKNRIWNYTLLDSSTNRSYGNAIFSGKRRVIIGKDKGLSIAIPKIGKDGKLQLGEEKKAKSSFVPPCTKQVFMKYYSATMSDANYWTKIDAEGYLKDIYDCINKLEE
ncbi:DUF262 domain-containing protein [Segatella bryantii]|uniref:DUF262 domain-containing protein n=1 Tax=Segatella bryantii TaxID=77095 RepID=UPI001EDBC919|nr:DUF262 domain-containing protein [Segatella bryantii]UKK76722.1 DUF262 domain-containing protein [Segatella bryantii]